MALTPEQQEAVRRAYAERQEAREREEELDRLYELWDEMSREIRIAENQLALRRDEREAVTQRMSELEGKPS